jgi:DNA-binding MarR family transcriptional regulator
LWAIKVIAESAPIKVSELARRMYLHPATVVGILDRLEGRGMVSRTRSKEDRRVVEVDLTDAGKSLVTQAPEVAQGLLVQGLEHMPTDELLVIAAGLEKLVSIFGAQEFPPKLIFSPGFNLPQTAPEVEAEQ